MPNKFDSRAKADVILSFERAELYRSQQSPLADTKDISLRWEIQSGLAQELVDWSFANRATIKDCDIKFASLPGVWRTVGIQIEHEDRYNPSAGKKYLIHTFSEGFLSEFSWEEVMLDKAITSPGNSSKIVFPTGGGAGGEVEGSDLTNSASDSPIAALYLKLVGCDPKLAYGIASSARTALSALTGNLTVRGVSYGAASGWHFVISSSTTGEDGSATITFVLAKPQFTINAFRNNNTANEEKVGYLFQVPESLGQSIITAWDAGQGRSASAQYDQSSGLMDIVLTCGGSKANMTTPWIGVSCDTYRRHHFAWGYTEDEVYESTGGTGFIANHNTAIGSTEDGKIIRARDINVQTRGDGLFDVIVVETSFDNVAAGNVYTSYPYFTFSSWTGTKITQRRDYGYNVAITNLNLLKLLYDTATQGVAGEVVPIAGKTCSFEVTREDDCSFDYVATISFQSAAITHTLTASETLGIGVAKTIMTLRGATQDELTAAAVNAMARKSIEIRIDSRDDELVDATIMSTTVQKAVDSGNSGSLGEWIEAGVGRNVDSGEFSTILSGTYASSRKRDIRVEFSANDDETFNYIILAKNRQETEKTGYHAGVRGEKSVTSVGRNVDTTTNLSSAAITTTGKSVELRAEFDDAGNMHYVKVESQKEAIDVSSAGGNKGESITVEKRINDCSEPDLLEPADDPEDGETVEWQVAIAQDGAIDWNKITKISNELHAGGSGDDDTTLCVARDRPKWKPHGFTDTAIIFKNIKPANIAGYFLGDEEYGRMESLVLNDDNTISGVKIVRTYAYNFSSAPSADLNKVDDITSWTKIIPHVRQSDTDATIQKCTETQTLSEKWTHSYLEAITFVDGKYNGDVSQLVVGGVSWWHAVAATSMPVFTSWE